MCVLSQCTYIDKAEFLPSCKNLIMQKWNYMGWRQKKYIFVWVQRYQLLVLSACEHNKRVIFLVLLRIIPLCLARLRLTFSPSVIAMNYVFFSSSQETFPFFVLVRASHYLRMWKQLMGSSSRPLNRNSCLSWLLFQDIHRWSPNFAPVKKIQLIGCEIIWAGANSYFV